jgi:hypothetical protein
MLRQGIGLLVRSPRSLGEVSDAPLEMWSCLGKWRADVHIAVVEFLTRTWDAIRNERDH